MEAFETCSNPSAYLHELAAQGYTSLKRGGGYAVVDGFQAREVSIIFGADLPPCALIQALDSSSGEQSYHTRTFADPTALAAWLRQYEVRLSHRERRLRG